MNMSPNTNRTWIRSLALMACVAGLVAQAGCTPMMAGQVAEAGYTAAKNTFGVGDLSATGGADRQQKLQSVMNSIEIGQDVKPVLDLMGEPPRIKSGNAYGYTCYEYPSVYSSSESAVIVAREGKVAFYGSSRCSTEMQDANFRKDGKYMTTGQTPAVQSSAAPPTDKTPINQIPTSQTPAAPASTDLQPAD